MGTNQRGKKSNDVDHLEAVLQHVGEMGRYQKLLFLGMLPFGFFFAFIYLVQMFIAVTPANYWCKIPELEHLDMELRRNLSAPGAASGMTWESCKTYDVNWTDVLETMTPPEGAPLVPCQHGWEFELSDIPYETIITERGWVCEYDSYGPIAQSIFFAGAFLGGLFFGWLADNFGRVPALIGSNLIGAVGGIATIYTTTLWDFIVCRFLVGMSFDNAFMMMYILVLEYVGARHRTWVANMSIALYFGGGCLSLPWIALWLNDWRKLAWYTSLPMFAVVIVPFVVPESARWLVSRGRVNQAVQVLRKFERVNKTKIPDDVMDEFIVSSNQTKLKKESVLVLFKSPLIRNMMIILLLVYISCSLIFDGLVRMSNAFGLDYFITFTLTSATEIPSITILTLVLDRWGRRNLTAIPMTLTGILIVIAMLVPKGIPQASLAIAARFFINMSYNTVIQWVTELLPTPVRASGSATLHMSGYIATIISPFIVYSEIAWSLLPLLILGIVALYGSGMSIFLPETKGLAMPQSLADSERIIREKSLCGKPADTEEDVKHKLDETAQDNDTDILESVLSHVGDMGLYQKLLFVAMLPFGFFFAWSYFVQMFITLAPQEHWCRIPELANLSLELRRNLSAPITATGGLERCMTYDTNWTKVLETLQPPPRDTRLVPCKHGWEFNFTDIPYETITTERGWVCDSASVVPTAQSVFFAGSFIGGIILGWMADKFGRVPALIGANVIGGVAGVATIFTSGVWDFIICRFLVGMSYDNCFMILYILVLEYVGPQHRTWVATMSIAIYFGAGCITLPWLALWVADWRIFLWITSLPMLIVLLAPWLLPESARWLVTQGRVKQAVKVLRRFESINGTKIPDDVMAEFIVSSNKSREEKQESVLAILKSPLLRRAMILMILLYMGCAIVFDALVRLSDSFGLDFFITFTMTSATEIPALTVLAIVLNRWGRRTLGVVPLSLAGLFVLLAIFVPNGLPQASLAIGARFFINMSYTAAIQWITEILPTAFRASGSSALHMSGYVATMLSPFVVYSERLWKVLPLVIMGVISLFSAGISLVLPETNGQPMPQTVSDGEKIIREQSLCGKSEDADEEVYKKSSII